MNETGIRVEFSAGLDPLTALAADWERLWGADPRRSMFTSFDWRVTAARWVEGEIHTAVALRDHQVVGILPLTLQGRTLRFLGAKWADYSDILCGRGERGAIVEAFLEAILASPIRWQECLLENVPDGASLLTGLENVPERLRRWIHVSPGAVCPTLLLGADREATLDALLGKKSLRQREARLGKRGELRFHHIEERAEARSHLFVLFDQHAARWAMAGDGSPFAKGDTRSFYEDLIEQLDPRGALRFSVLTLDGRPIAHHLGFEVGGTFTFYKPTFDVDYWDYSPGDVLLKHLLTYVRERPVTEFDFTRGDEAYKARFANHARLNRTVRLYRPGLRGSSARFLLQAREQLRDPERAPAPVLAALSLQRRAGEALAPARRRGFLRALAGGAGRWVRTWFRARDEAVVRVVRRSDDDVSASEVAIVPASLGSLALLAAERPGSLDPARLAQARSRLKAGDQAWIARSPRGGDAQVFWSATRSEITCPGGEEALVRLALPAESTVVYDRWTTGGAFDAVAEGAALRELARRSPRAEIHVVIPLSREAARAAGGRATHRIGASHVLRAYRRTWIHEVRES